MKFNAKIFELSCFAALLLTVLLSVSSFESKCDSVRQEVLRLHVVANSDSDEDQAVKLLVRDALLEKSKTVFSENATLAEAEKEACGNIGLLFETAKKTLEENGFDGAVSVSVGKSSFPTKSYGSITLPAGEYCAVRVEIGESKGKNWWCVMFPPLCLSAATGEEELSDVLSGGEMELVKSRPKYEIRFWIVEKLEQLKERYNKFRENREKS